MSKLIKPSIPNKIKILLDKSVEVVRTDSMDAWKAYMKKTQELDVLMDELKALARKEKTLLGRIIKFPVADGYAIYVITKVNKARVKIEWIDYADGWVDDRCGKAALLDINYATEKIAGEDALEKLFSKSK